MTTISTEEDDLREIEKQERRIRGEILNLSYDAVRNSLLAPGLLVLTALMLMVVGIAFVVEENMKAPGETTDGKKHIHEYITFTYAALLPAILILLNLRFNIMGTTRERIKTSRTLIRVELACWWTKVLIGAALLALIAEVVATIVRGTVGDFTTARRIPFVVSLALSVVYAMFTVACIVIYNRVEVACDQMAQMRADYNMPRRRKGFRMM